jgi:anti-sigma-K factor RskA
MSAAELSDDDELLAAELAFGLIEGEELRNAEARLRVDAAFAAAHGRWQARSAAMFTDAGEAPPAAVWNTIEARLPANDMGLLRFPPKCCTAGASAR